MSKSNDELKQDVLAVREWFFKAPEVETTETIARQGLWCCGVIIGMLDKKDGAKTIEEHIHSGRHTRHEVLKTYSTGFGHANFMLGVLTQCEIIFAAELMFSEFNICNVWGLVFVAIALTAILCFKARLKRDFNDFERKMDDLDTSYRESNN